MDALIHRFHDLFAQLGLPTDAASIEQFITLHRPLAAGVPLPEAPFWSDAQAAFLHAACTQDADWAAVVDQLNLALR